jgi:WD40 repeat protein
MKVTGPDAAAGTARPEGPRKAYDAFISYAHEADEVFAPVLQRGLQHLAKPWNRRRAMEVFRDESNLAASPGLWPSIQKALDASRWLVLLASPQAARSDWVGEEITHWVSSKGTDHLLVVVTDGSWIWDKGSGDLSLASTASSPALRGVFPAEPKYLDMTWAQRDADLTLRNARFRDQIATLAAAIRDVPKEDIEGEDVRQQRRTRRITRAVIAALTMLLLVAAVLGFVANTQRNQAVHQRQEAIHERNVAISGQLSSESQLLGGGAPVISRLLSIVAWHLNRSSNAARYAMLTAAAMPAVRVLGENAEPVHSVAFSPDGTTLAVGSGRPGTATSGDGVVRLWEVATGRQSGVLEAGSQPVLAVAFSHDGNIVAGGSRNGFVLLWDVTTHQPVGRPLRAGTGPVTSLAFSPRGSILAVGGTGGIVRLWDVTSRRPVGGPLTGVSGAVTSVAFSRDGATVAAGGADGTARLWHVASHQPVGRPLRAGAGRVNSVAFSPRGSILAVGGTGGIVRLWNVTSRRPVGGPLTGVSGAVTSVAFSRDGKVLATGGKDGTARLWDVATHEPVGGPLTGHTGAVTSVAFSPDGKTLATGSSDGTVRLWDVATGGLTGGPLTGHTGAVTSVAFSRDGKILATGSKDGTARLWDVATQQPIGGPLTGHAGPVTSIAFSPDGKTLATGSSDGTVRLWDVASHQRIGRALGIPQSPVTSVAFSPDGAILATASSKTPAHQSFYNPTGPVWLWNVATQQPIGGALPGTTGPVTSVAFRPDGKLLAAGTTAGDVWSWDTATRQLSGLGAIGLGGAYGPVTSVAFRPHSKTLAVGSLDQTVRLWQMGPVQQLGGPFTDPTGPVTAVAFSPDGKTLATGSGDGTARLWDVATHQQIGESLTGQAGPVTSVAFSPGGTMLATGSDDHTVRLWNVSYLVNVVQYLCAAAGRNLSGPEWAHYVASGATFQRLCHFRSAGIPPHAVPTLGRFAGGYAINGVGFGQVRPKEIFNGGDASGMVSHITWKSWGGPKAIGTGTAEYVRPNQSSASGAEEPATVVAFNLGLCGGKLMYRAVEWYFPQHGQAFNPSQYENICTGGYSSP